MPKTSVLIADDHFVVRVGLEYMLGASRSYEVVAHASTGVEAVEKARSLRPSVVLMDLSMPEMDGVEATRRIKEEFPEIRVVVMSMYDDDQCVADAVQAGADGYILKTTPPEEFSRAIDLAARGGVAIDASLFHRAMKSMRGANGVSHHGREPPIVQRDVCGGLSEREAVVLGLLAKGLTNKEIGARLVISPGTVKRHVESILAKLGAADRTDAVAIAFRRGLVK